MLFLYLFLAPLNFCFLIFVFLIQPLFSLLAVLQIRFENPKFAFWLNLVIFKLLNLIFQLINLGFNFVDVLFVVINLLLHILCFLFLHVFFPLHLCQISLCFLFRLLHLFNTVLQAFNFLFRILNCMDRSFQLGL